MDKLIIQGGSRLQGEIKVSGAKNVAMKVILAGLLTEKTLIISNIPHISSVFGTIDIVKHLGLDVKLENHTLELHGDKVNNASIPLECGGLYRTAPMMMGPLLARFGQAVVPNPGGCRLGKRPIDRHIDGLEAMGAKIEYKQGYFYASAKKLHGAKYRFKQNTHTGTETLILAAVLAYGETVIENASAEPEVDDLIKLLNIMGGKIHRKKERTIVIEGVKDLNGAHFTIMPDRNEVVTFAIAAYTTGGKITIHDVQIKHLESFFEGLKKVGAHYEIHDADKVTFYAAKKLKSTDIITTAHPGFMTDWQAPWAILMTQAHGTSTIHETVYEDRFGYASQLVKMGARISFFHPDVKNPESFYNFNWDDRQKNQFQAISIEGPTRLHNAVLEATDLRAGATLVLAALSAQGESIIRGIEHIDRGYEKLEERLIRLGAHIKRVSV
jgi:UDP-N-acetylglucosamine 1-carboxyvinyltransferase